MSGKDPFAFIREINEEVKRTGRSFASVALEMKHPEGTERKILRVLSVPLKPLSRGDVQRIIVYAWGGGLVTKDQLERICSGPTTQIFNETSDDPAYGISNEEIQDDIREQFRAEDPIAFGAVVSFFVRELTDAMGDWPDDDTPNGIQMAHFAYYSQLLNPDHAYEVFITTINDLHAQILHAKYLRRRLERSLA